MTKIADATCPSCHASLEVNETVHPEPHELSRIRRVLRRVGRFLIAVSQIGQYVPEATETRRVDEHVVDRVPRCGVVITRGPVSPWGSLRRSDRRVCNQPAPNFRRATDPRRFGPYTDDVSLAVCDECAARWVAGLPRWRDESEILVDMREKNGASDVAAKA
jgi:hypothetical protein